MKIHPLTDVQSTQIGKNTKIWQFCVILENAIIGENCNINCNVFIENNVLIGNSVTIKPGVQIWDGIEIHDMVFIGPNATFTNDVIPRSKQYPDKFSKTIVEKGASIGANATICPGLNIGKYAMVGAGSVVTKNVLPFSLVVGNPAKIIGYITEKGVRVNLDLTDEEGNKYTYLQNELRKMI